MRSHHRARILESSDAICQIGLIRVGFNSREQPVRHDIVRQHAAGAAGNGQQGHITVGHELRLLDPGGVATGRKLVRAPGTEPDISKLRKRAAWSPRISHNCL